MTYRVAHVGTGLLGTFGLRGVIRHPDLELVAVHAHGADKQQRDAGDLVGMPATGIIAEPDLDKIIAMKPDCISYMSKWVGREQAVMDETIRILEAGIDVASIAHLPLCYPPKALESEMRDRIEAACKKGGSSFMASGFDPGFLDDALPVALMSVVDRVDVVRMQEVGCYDHYAVEDVLRDLFGFGRPIEYKSPFFERDGLLERAWAPSLHEIADRLGVKLDGFNIVCNKVLTDVPLQVKIGTIDAGTVAGLHFALEGLVGGKPRIIIEHFNRMLPHIAPHWPKIEISNEVSYRIVIEGEPSITCTMDLKAEREGDEGVEICAAMRVVNAIPSLCRAEPGATWATKLPTYTARAAWN